MLLLLSSFGVAFATWRALLPLPEVLGQDPSLDAIDLAPVTAMDGTPLTISFRGRYNQAAVRDLSAIPSLLRKAFVMAEDQRFWRHSGIDWAARLAALWGNLWAGRNKRGASTIAEQAVRIIHPRPRTYWSHWVAGFDAQRLVQRFGRAQVLAFYLNQVPYAAQRRGVVQAAPYYFGRDLGALNAAQQLALAVLVRSPEGYDPRQHPTRLRQAVNTLAKRLLDAGDIHADQYRAIQHAALQPKQRPLAVDAGPFVIQARRQAREYGFTGQALRTTLDAELQQAVQQRLRAQQQALASANVRNAAALVVDNSSGGVLAWAVAPAGDPYDIDPVVTPRQPGSTLKPFVYGLALAELGWQADRVLMDTPLSERVQEGIHHYRNYSGKHYGPVSVRYALGNSLNIPAVRVAQAVGVRKIVTLFRALGFQDFTQSMDHYGAAIVLGDGAVSLFDLVQGYASLARRGNFLPLTLLADTIQPEPPAVMPGAVTSLVADILSDPEARAAEFGHDSLLNLPSPTAMKTGTSSDYHDSWTVGFDDQYTVGVWMGRLDGGVTQKITGAHGAAPVVRQIFKVLRQQAPYAGLWLSPELQSFPSCQRLGPPPCIERQEWRLPEQSSSPKTTRTNAAHAVKIPRIKQPLANEQLAIDPRTPRSAQTYRFRLETAGHDIRKVVWRLNDQPLSGRPEEDFSQRWRIQPGQHQLRASVWVAERDAPYELGPVPFSVAGEGYDELP